MLQQSFLSLFQADAPTEGDSETTSEAGSVNAALRAHSAAVMTRALVASVLRASREPPSSSEEDDEEELHAESWGDLDFCKGSAVSFKDDVREPKHGWQGLEGASRSWVGNVRARCSDGSIIVDFPHTTIVKAQSEELRVDDDAETVRPGSLVHVRSTIDEPEFGWGNVDGMSVGIVRDVSRGEVEVDFAQAPGGWRCLLTELEVVTDHADAEATEGGAVRAGADRLKREAIVGLYSFPIGSAVRVKPNVLEPRHQWGQVRPGSVGRMLGVSTNGYQVLINFPEADHWKAHPEDIEIINSADAIRPGVEVQVRKSVSRPRYDWPEGVNHDTVGTVSHVTYDGRVTATFASCRRPKRKYVFHLKELKPVAWSDCADGGTHTAAAGVEGASGDNTGPQAASARAWRVQPQFPDERKLGIACPITLDIMKDPVVAEDGETYERGAIESHFEGLARDGQSLRSPLTNQPLSNRLVPNRAMQRLIREVTESKGQPSEDTGARASSVGALASPDGQPASKRSKIERATNGRDSVLPLPDTSSASASSSSSASRSRSRARDVSWAAAGSAGPVVASGFAVRATRSAVAAAEELNARPVGAPGKRKRSAPAVATSGAEKMDGPRVAHRTRSRSSGPTSSM